MASGEQTAPPNPWRETVRDIYDLLHFTVPGDDLLRARLLALIESRHADYFGGPAKKGTPDMPLTADGSVFGDGDGWG